MKSLTLNQTIALILSGAFAGYIVTHAIFILSWVCYLPLFFLLKDKSVKEGLISGIAFGIGVSIVFFFWMIGGAKEFSGNNLFYGFLIPVISTILFCLYWAGLMTIVSLGLKKTSGRVFLKPLIVASCFVLGESLLMLCFSQLPYYLFNSGDGLLNNLYTIQWASYFGLPVLNFIVVVINYLTLEIISAKKWKQLLIPFGTIGLVMVSGFFIKQNAEQKVISKKPVKVAIAAENVPPQLKWNEHNGNILVQRLLTLNKQAASLKPDIVLWSESTVPWTYEPDDDFLKEILKESYPKETIHMIGFMSEHSPSKAYNSVYGITASGKMMGRYNKRILLQFVETPLFGLNLPFLDMEGYLIEKGKSDIPIATPFGYAGIAICNEIVRPESTTTMVEKGAEFLLNPSNDAWFRDSYIAEIHFLYSRLSAIINRKDVVVNSNNGFSGYIKYTGEVLLKRKSEEAFVEIVDIFPNRYNNSKNYMPWILPVFSILLLLHVFLIGFLKKKS